MSASKSDRKETPPRKLVRDVMTQEVLTCGPTDSLNRAAQLMWEGDVGCIAVIEAGSRPIAVVTDRDLCMAAYHRDARPTELVVSDAMSRSIHTARQDDPLAELEATMRESQIRRVPVVDGDGRLVGIVSLNDLALHKDDRAGDGLDSQEVADTLKAICEPHRREPAPGTRVGSPG